MKKKNKLTILLLSIFFLLLFSKSSVHAQETSQADAGLTPDSPFYFMDTWGEDIALALAVDPEVKIQKQYEISQEKLSEIEIMVNKQMANETVEATNRYSKMINASVQTVTEATQSGKKINQDLIELISTSIAKATERLVKVLEKAPEQARKSIQTALQYSTQGSQRVSEVIEIEKREVLKQEVRTQLESVKQQAPDDIKQYIQPDTYLDTQDRETGEDSTGTSTKTNTLDVIDSDYQDDIDNNTDSSSKTGIKTFNSSLK